MKHKYLSLLLVVMLAGFCFADLTPQKYTSAAPKAVYQFKDFVEIASIDRKHLNVKSQSAAWQRNMKNLGQSMENSQVGMIYFVHGTFVGNDPIGIVKSLKVIFPKMTPDVEKKLLRLAKLFNDKLNKDLGNYPDQYVQLFEKAIGGNIPCRNFQWSSANHHIARLRGSIKLAEQMAADIDRYNLTGKRVLLVGHSHAGQLFALLTNFLAGSQGVDRLLTIAEKDKIDLEQSLGKIRTVSLDIFTFGTPPRYGWGDNYNYRLVNVINHRGNSHLAGTITGVFTTKDGDYVQQWGIAGTDICAATNKDKQLNKQLDGILGVGQNPVKWEEYAKVKMRIPHYGKTLLVDYKDNSFVLPNCISTALGHGYYTNYEKMLFNTKMIVDEMYR